VTFSERLLARTLDFQSPVFHLLVLRRMKAKVEKFPVLSTVANRQTYTRFFIRAFILASTYYYSNEGPARR
jgi:hypothetical protein